VIGISTSAVSPSIIQMLLTKASKGDGEPRPYLRFAPFSSFDSPLGGQNSHLDRKGFADSYPRLSTTLPFCVIGT
jgi:hypothetical protein